MTIPLEPKIYHIVHIDRLPSILTEGGLVSDAAMQEHLKAGTEIGIPSIKRRRLQELQLNNHPGLYVGQCVPFYFCPRSVMLYVLHRGHSDLPYQGGQEPIIHLEADMRQTVAWAEENELRWAFTTSNAGAYRFQDFASLDSLGEINWQIVRATKWAEDTSAKQAEFLIESRFPWQLVDRIGVMNRDRRTEVENYIRHENHRPTVTAIRGWYY